MFRNYLAGVCCVTAILGLTGCETIHNSRESESILAQQRGDMRILRQNVGSIAGRLEGVEMENERLAKLCERQNSSGEIRALRTEVQQLQERLSALESAREKDKQELVAVISRKLEALMEKSPAAGGTGSSAGVYCREHVVQTGETLSAIAKAYGVTVDAIVEASDLSNPDKLHPNQTLRIPE